MSEKKEAEVVRIDLTAEQKEQIKEATEKSVDAKTPRRKEERWR